MDAAQGLLAKINAWIERNLIGNECQCQHCPCLLRADEECRCSGDLCRRCRNCTRHCGCQERREQAG